MKETLDLVRTTRPEKNRLLASTNLRSRPSCAEPCENASIADHSLSDGAVWLFLAILALVIVASGYIFWAKLNSAWPFDF